MLLTVFCLRRDRSELTFSLQVDADFELQNFRALCELESGIPAAESQIVYAERPLTDNHRSLASYGLKDGDVVILQQVDNVEARPPAPFPGLPRIDFSSITVPGTSAQLPQPSPQQPAAQGSRPSPPDLPSSPQGLDNPALLRDMLLANPHELSLLKERNPPLAEALLSGDLEKFTRVLVEQQQDRARREQERIRLFSADPFDLEAQAKIEEDIRQQNIEENMTIAMEEAPESFGQVVMLYINCKVNGHPVKAFVDSGAQMTIMSQACAERCNIMRLVDRRWAGIAKGVGTQKIIGRVHLAQVQIEGDFLPCSFSILEEQPMDMLLGLDMLKRHQCSIDLKKNVLVIGTTGSQTAFLPEGELPECARLAYGAGREDVRPEEIADQELAEALQKSVEEAENSDKATTSLERPLLPTSDRFMRLVSFPEIGLRTGQPASRLLGRSASAPSVCSHTGSQAETVNRRAARSEESLLECPKALLREGLPLSPLTFSDHAACATVDASLAEEEPGAEASPSPCLPSQNIPPRPVPSSSQKETKAEDSMLDQGSPVEVAGGGSGLSDAQRPAEDLAAGFPSKPLEPDQRSELHLGLQTHNESAKGRSPLPDDQGSEPADREHLCTTKISPLPAKGGQLFAFSAEGGSTREGGRGWPSAEGRRPGSAACTSPRSESFMEVEVAEEALVVAGHLLGQQEVGLPGMALRGSPMEVDLPQLGSSWSDDSLPGGDLMQPGSTVFGVTDTSAVVSLSTSPSEGQLSSLAEEPCPSLTSALKELHRLLVESCKGDSQEENGGQPAGLPEEEAANQGAVEGDCDCPEVERLFPDSGGGEASTRMRLFEAPVESPGLQGMHRLVMRRSWQEALVVEEPLDLNTRSPAAAASSQFQGSELPEILPPHLSSSQDPGHKVLGRNQAELFSGFPQAEDASQSACSSSPVGPGMPLGVQGSAAEPPQPLPVGSPVIGPVALQPPVFPAADIDRIAGAGFTPQEAGEALARAGGNADLALLILLAKNIVVPI